MILLGLPVSDDRWAARDWEPPPGDRTAARRGRHSGPSPGRPRLRPAPAAAAQRGGWSDNRDTRAVTWVEKLDSDSELALEGTARPLHLQDAHWQVILGNIETGPIFPNMQ